MPFFLKLLYFLQTGRTRPETREEEEARLHSDRLWGTKTRRISGIKIILICFFSLAIIAKLFLQAVTGSSFDLDLATSFSLLSVGAIVLCFIWVLRRLFVWRYGVSEIAGGSHAPKSPHYQGRAVDINYVNGVHVTRLSNSAGTVERCSRSVVSAQNA